MSIGQFMVQYFYTMLRIYYAIKLQVGTELCSKHISIERVLIALLFPCTEVYDTPLKLTLDHTQ